MQEVPIYFTYPSPFSYLAWHRITSHPERYPGIRFRWTPVMFRRLMALQDGPVAGSPPLLLEYNYDDARRWARAYGIPMETPERRDPTNQATHKVHLLAQDAGGTWEQRWMKAVYKMIREQGRDPTDVTRVHELAQAVGVPGLANLADVALDERMEANTQQALCDGAVGVPFVRFQGESYWGNDRLAWLEARVGGQSAPAAL